MNYSIPDRTAVFKFLLVAAFLVVVVPIAIAAFPQVVGAEEGYVVESSSMSPAIGAGDLVIVNDIAPAQIENGDIITFRRGTEGTIVTHRVVEIERTNGQYRFTTKGDANDAPDSQPVRGENVIGKVWFSVPLAGYIVAFGNTQFGLAALVVVPSVLLLVSELRDIYRSSDIQIRAK